MSAGGAVSGHAAVIFGNGIAIGIREAHPYAHMAIDTIAIPLLAGDGHSMVMSVDGGVGNTGAENPGFSKLACNGTRGTMAYSCSYARVSANDVKETGSKWASEHQLVLFTTFCNGTFKP